MSTFTPAILREYIDSIDAIFRGAVETGTLAEVYVGDRDALVSFFFRH